MMIVILKHLEFFMQYSRNKPFLDANGIIADFSSDNKSNGSFEFKTNSR